MEESHIKVMLVDDHEMVRSGLAVFLSGFDYLELVGQAADGAEAIHLCDEVQPDVILMDLMMPGINGVEAIHAIRQAHPQTQVIALTSFREEDLVEAAIRAGAIGFLYKNTSVDELAQAITAAYYGKHTLAAEAAQTLFKLVGERNTHVDTPPLVLSARELQILEHLVNGLTNRQIAHELELSPATIKVYISQLLVKLGAASRTEAVAIALRKHLLS